MPRTVADGALARAAVRLVVLACCAWGMFACLSSGWMPGANADEPPAERPLHERLDQLLESVLPGLIAPPADDADFLRRVYLDLNGTIPDAGATRAFLDDKTPNKREALVDRLLARPEFARHFSRVFDVMLLERRPANHVKAEEWQAYLHKSFADNKPLDQLAREILSADGADESTRPAARFYLDREGDPNLLARDVGRLFFGRDLQCAQCHDHPLIDDYLQSEYYGLMAFVNRGTLFVGKDKKTIYAEAADGEVNYKSVFTGDARDRVVPKLPHEAPLAEPMLNKEEQYVVAPDKTVRGVPRYSRRAQLAANATNGASEAFNRNLANRLWAHMMGRGLVQPLDFQHSGNPPANAQALQMGAAELVKMKFDAKKFLRELALSRAYQRSSAEPAPPSMQVDAAALTASIAGWKAEVEKIDGQLTALQEASSQGISELNAAYEKFSKSAAARDAVDKARAEARKASDVVAAVLAGAIKEVTAKEEIFKALVEARDKAKIVVAKLPDDKSLAEAAKQYVARAAEVDAQLAAARKSVAEKTPETQVLSLKLAEADKAAQAAVGELAVARTALDAADAQSRGSLEKHRAAKALKGELTARMTAAQSLVDHLALRLAVEQSQVAARAMSEQFAAAQSQTQMQTTTEQLAAAESAAKTAQEKAVADREALDQSWTNLIESATNRFTLAPLKAISPEQLAWATMQAVGLVDAQRAAIEATVKKEIEPMAELSPSMRAAYAEQLIERRVDEKLRGNMASFVSLFGQQPGQAATFQATVHQALFLANGGLLAGWLNAGNNNLTERLSKMAEPSVVADELYVSVFSRRPTPDEQAQVIAYWNAPNVDRAAAAREMVWSLLTSAEFRFNR